ncbi:MAG: PHP domain-containing protein [Elainellaceae cyanobacterium]
MAVDLARSSVWSAAQDAATLKSIFGTITAESCPRSFNFHIHTVCSDGRLQPEQVVQQAIEIGLTGLAITDHHSVKGYHQAQQWLEDWLWSSSGQAHLQSAPRLWTGMEINAELLETEVHVLAYAFCPDHQALYPYQQGTAPVGEAYAAARVVKSIHAAGGLAVLAHPARYRRSAADLIIEAARLGFDGIETYYSYNNSSPWQPSPQQTQQAEALGTAHGLLHTCGTDTHGLSLLLRL